MMFMIVEGVVVMFMIVGVCDGDVCDSGGCGCDVYDSGGECDGDVYDSGRVYCDGVKV